MSKRYTITLSDEASEKLLRFIGWTEDSAEKPAKALQNWLHQLISLAPPMHGGLREGAFGRTINKKKPKK